MTAAARTLSELAHLVGGEVVGDGGVRIWKAASIDEAGPGDITFLAHPRYNSLLKGCKASAVILSSGTDYAELMKAGRSVLVAAQPYLAFAKILQLLTEPPRYDGVVSDRATVDPTATLGDGVTVFPYVYIGKRVKVGARAVLFPGVFLGDEVQVGDDCILHPNVAVREGCRLGQRVILHAGVVIGADGFGYAGEGGGRIKIPQVGIVEIEDDVEIGANTTVDRATLGRTVIGRGTKIDNLVQIAHNVVVGEHAVIAAQAGIAGSTRIGREVVLAGQVGIVNHIEIGDRSMIGPQSGVARSVSPGSLLSGGLEAAPHREWLRVMTLIPQLPKIWRKVRLLERKISTLRRKAGKGVKDHA
ncbi:MAG: UDP-3-O-(3-hydroxymyristoyl)glucosamine N-acyltransferase [Deltaproteobacteria bacterium]|nr:UDP-3-O-(3-hydroxymyristoyl)glucosamine N-acyltransferase [Deltaproteobacteria bacterium]